MSKRIDYNNDNNIASASSATIAPNQAPNAAPAVAKSSKMTTGTKIAAIVLIILAICAIALLIVNVVVNSYAAKLNASHYEKVEITPVLPPNEGIYGDVYKSNTEYIEAANGVLLNFAEASHSIKSSENIENFAIYGINKFADSDSGLATFVVIASFNKDTKKVTYITFTETALVYIPMVGVGRLTDAYQFGGSALLTKTIKYNFGFDINGYIETDMTMASKLFDSVGGVTVSNTSTTAMTAAIDSYNEKFNTKVEVPEVSNGKAQLNGMQAIAFLRASNENLSQVVKALGVAIFTEGLFGMKDAFNLIISGTKVALERDDLTTLAKMSLSMLKSAETSYLVVGDETKFSLYYKGSYAYVIDGEFERNKVITAIYGEQK